MLYYVPQIWCSDNTDALCRVEIQCGTTMLFPPSTMGCHVSAVPNHQTMRTVPLQTRFAVALGGCFGYELDPRALTDDERRLTPENLKHMVSSAKPGATLRVQSCPSSCSGLIPKIRLFHPVFFGSGMDGMPVPAFPVRPVFWPKIRLWLPVPPLCAAWMPLSCCQSSISWLTPAPAGAMAG